VPLDAPSLPPPLSHYPNTKLGAWQLWLESALYFIENGAASSSDVQKYHQLTALRFTVKIYFASLRPKYKVVY
jgi:hypothetical protein